MERVLREQKFLKPVSAWRDFTAANFPCSGFNCSVPPFQITSCRQREIFGIEAHHRQPKNLTGISVLYKCGESCHTYSRTRQRPGIWKVSHCFCKTLCLNIHDWCLDFFNFFFLESSELCTMAHVGKGLLNPSFSRVNMEALAKRIWNASAT